MKIDSKTSEIKLHLDTMEDGYSQYSSEENLLLHKNLYYYVEETALDYDLTDKFAIKIHVGQNASQKEKETFASCFKKHYQQELAYKERDIRKDDLVAFVMLGIGLLMLAVLWWFSTINMHFIVYTAIEILTWVFLWEFVDTFFFKRTRDRAEVIFYKRLMNAEFSFSCAKKIK